MTRRCYRIQTGGNVTSGTKRTTTPLLLASATSSSLREERRMQDRTDRDALLTPSEVAEMFRVNPKTVTRWARAGKISAIRTLGGHRRFRAIEIAKFLEQVESDQGL
jgi:excisionase family DNA binding protein